MAEQLRRVALLIGDLRRRQEADEAMMLRLQACEAEWQGALASLAAEPW